jgi:hypothetical protein
MAFPTVEHCLVCDDIRLEALNKHTILGFYGICPNVGIRLSAFGKPMDRLTFAMFAGVGDGVEHELAANLIGPNDEKVVEFPSMKVAPPAGKRFGFSFAIGGLVFKAEGRHKLELSVDGARWYEAPFDVQKGDPQDFRPN